MTDRKAVEDAPLPRRTMGAVLNFPQTPADLLSAADKAVKRGDLRTAIRYAQRALEDNTCLTSPTLARVRDLIDEMRAAVAEEPA